MTVIVERIEEWVGREALDAAGERVGKLDEVFYSTSSGDAVFAAVKSGLLGRHSSFVPLASASAGRDYVRLAYPKATIEDADSEIKGGDGVDRDSARRLGELYGVQLAADEEFESATVINERREAAEAAQRRAAELEEEARRRESDAHEAKGSAQSAQEQAAAKAEESQQARADAEQARRDAEQITPSQ
jgi:hypothetical protein